MVKKYKEVVKRLKKEGYYLVRVNGSHEIYKHPSGISCPIKCTETDIPAGTVSKIEKITGIKF